jgi:hypothetical protein
MLFLGYNNGDIHYKSWIFELKNDLCVGSKIHFSFPWIKELKHEFIVQYIE